MASVMGRVCRVDVGAQRLGRPARSAAGVLAHQVKAGGRDDPQPQGSLPDNQTRIGVCWLQLEGCWVDTRGDFLSTDCLDSVRLLRGQCPAQFLPVTHTRTMPSQLSQLP